MTSVKVLVIIFFLSLAVGFLMTPLGWLVAAGMIVGGLGPSGRSAPKPTSGSS
jgi:hypothetical protein